MIVEVLLDATLAGLFCGEAAKYIANGQMWAVPFAILACLFWRLFWIDYDKLKEKKR